LWTPNLKTNWLLINGPFFLKNQDEQKVEGGAQGKDEEPSFARDKIGSPAPPSQVSSSSSSGGGGGVRVNTHYMVVVVVTGSGEGHSDD